MNVTPHSFKMVYEGVPVQKITLSFTEHLISYTNFASLFSHRTATQDSIQKCSWHLPRVQCLRISEAHAPSQIGGTAATTFSRPPPAPSVSVVPI